mgnify:CR=1 FL=1
MFILLVFNTALYIVLKIKKNEILVNIIYASVVLLILSGSLLVYKFNTSKLVEGVIISKKITAHEGPSSTLPELFFIHEGHEVIIKKEQPEWSEIELQNGFHGWVQNKFLEKI